MVSLLLHCGIDEKDDLIAELYECGTTGIVEMEAPGGGCTLDVFFDTAPEAAIAQERFARYAPEWINHGERDYIREFQDHWRAVAVGERFWLAPPWHAGPAPEGRLRLDYQPGMACGSGAHPCTQLCIEALEGVARPGSAVLDVGSGSGILLLAAGLLGASRLVGCDIDHESMAIAKEAVPGALLFTGSPRSVRDGLFDVVIANISSIAAEELAADLRRVCRAGGTIIVSGFRGSDLPEGYEGARRTEQEEWACLTVSPPDSER
ncbi:MAG: 50S ribosomal protein L11 methyltransferase [Bryobacterales bacterium]|nr:50S ribosomal protein L11 methyltransferase [Bryobacterales bacterium]